MRRGALSVKKRKRRSDIATALEAQGLPAAIASRMAFQFVFKFSDDELGDHSVWRAAGQILRQEMARLSHHLGLAERQIVCVLPKMQIETVVPDNIVDMTIQALVTAARTGEIGDGRVFVTPVESSYKIRTGEREMM